MEKEASNDAPQTTAVDSQATVSVKNGQNRIGYQMVVDAKIATIDNNTGRTTKVGRRTVCDKHSSVGQVWLLDNVGINRRCKVRDVISEIMVYGHL